MPVTRSLRVNPLEINHPRSTNLLGVGSLRLLRKRFLLSQPLFTCGPLLPPACRTMTSMKKQTLGSLW